MEPKPHRRRHHRFSQQRQVMVIAGILLLAALALVIGLLWLVNLPKVGSN
jgi:hypothetical protein